MGFGQGEWEDQVERVKSASKVGAGRHLKVSSSCDFHRGSGLGRDIWSPLDITAETGRLRVYTRMGFILYFLECRTRLNGVVF